ncbi:unnamed protein product [Closterium sp. Yama58-4]|nr:unnamed protein product [Closterium sp. Yama58-4]
MKPSYKNSAGLAKYEKSFLAEATGTVEWRVVEVELSNGMKVTVHVTSIVEALVAMYSDSANIDGFVVKPAAVYTSDKKQRIYAGPETGDGWIKMQEECPRGGVIAACILYSDGTNLSNDGRVTGHPVYFTLGNVTLKNRWQPHGHRMVAMLPPLPNVDSRTDEGKALHREVFQLALDVVLKELKEASYGGILTKDPFGQSQMVFPAVYAYVADHPEACKLAGTFASHKAMFPCHRCLVNREDISNMEAVVRFRKEDDQSEKVEALLALPSGSERNKASKAISTHPIKVRLQKSEFDITKVHSLAHVVEDIIRSGVPMHYSANMYEYLHQPLVKRAYRASNKRDPIPQIVKHDVRMHMLRVLQASEAPSKDGPKRMVALQEWKAHALAAPSDMTKLAGLLEGKAEEGEVLNGTIRVKNGMAIPGDEDFTKYSSQTHYVRACASFGDKPWFNDVAVLGEEEIEAVGGQTTRRKVIWYARLLLLFTIDVYATETKAFSKRAYAFVRYFRATGAMHASKCPVYAWEAGDNEYQLLELDNILRVAHMVSVRNMAIGVPAEIMELQRKRSRTSNRRLEGYELGSPTTGTRRTSTPAQQVGTPSALPAQPPPLQDLEALDAEHTAENGVASPHDASNATAPVAQRGAAANVVASAGTGALRSSDRDVHHPEANSYNHIDAAIRGDLQDVRTLMLRIENRLRVSDEIHQTLAATVKNLLEIVHQPSWCNEKTMEDACKKACDDLLKGSDVSQRVIYPDEDQFRAAVVVHLALDPEDFGKFNDYWKKGEWAKKCTDICNGRRGKLGNKSRKASFKQLKYPDNKAVKDSVEDRRDYEFGLPWHVFEDKPFCSEAFLAAASKWQKKEGDVYTLSIDQLCYTMVAVEFEMLSRDRSSMFSDSENNTREMTKRKFQVERWVRRASIPLVSGFYYFGDVIVKDWQIVDDI